MEATRETLIQYIPNTITFLAVLGFLFGGGITLRLVTFIWLYFIRPSSLPKYAVKNAYALVTGSSDGIGRGFAIELAARGFNLVLHGRNQNKLDAVKKSIQASHPTLKVLTVIADASDSVNMLASTSAIASRLRETLDGPLTVLINNAGGTQPQRDGFATFRALSPAEIDAMIALNARFHIQLTRALMPLLLAEEGPDAGTKHRPALILYTGSAAGQHPGPWLTMYSATKACATNWLIALGREMFETNPHVEAMNIVTGIVTDTAYFKQKPRLFEPDSRTFASAVFDRVGCGRLSIVGYWPHALQAFVLDSMPEWLQTYSVTMFLKKGFEELKEKEKAKTT